MQSLVELISTVPMEPPALVELASSLPTELAAAPVELASTIPMNSPVPVELASTIPMNSPAREPIPLAPPPSRAEPDARQAATLQLVVSTGLDVGLKRRGKPNEDSLLALQNTRFLRGNACPVGLFVVADGMGGHENGQEASNLVTQSLSKSVMPTVIYGPTDDNYAELLAEGVHHANLEVYQRNRQASVDMGTTIVAALVINTTAYIVSAGDSRVYLYRASSGLTQITRDHSTVARLVENGLIKPEEVYTHPRRNEIYRSLGHHPSEDLDKFILALQPDDVLMLCSDGLWEMVRDEHIQEIIANTASQPKQTSAALVQAALDGGGKDNISVIVVSVKAIAGTQTAWAG
jgi:serine/threonine protein phosphatase PrpC